MEYPYNGHIYTVHLSGLSAGVQGLPATVECLSAGAWAYLEREAGEEILFIV